MPLTLDTGRPTPEEYAPYFENYVKHVPETDIRTALVEQIDELHTTLGDVSVADATCLHAPYTWTIDQVLGHINDTEHIFGYRARCFASGEEASLPGFEQDDYVANSDYTDVQTGDLLKEFEYLRRSFICFCDRLPADKWVATGIADGKPMSVRAIAFIQVGHVRHHLKIVRKRLNHDA